MTCFRAVFCGRGRAGAHLALGLLRGEERPVVALRPVRAGGGRASIRRPKRFRCFASKHPRLRVYVLRGTARRWRGSAIRG
jgi:hypothetical protein